MAHNISSQKIKAALDKDARDIADIWRDAIRKYKGTTGLVLQFEFGSTNEMVQFGTDQMNAFHRYRHDQKKFDKLRILFVQNVDFIELGTQPLVAAAIVVALTFLLKACKQGSAEYDVVTAFFEDMNAFLQRIKILESRLPSSPAYRNCLMDVFTSFLDMRAFATKFIELGQSKKWMIDAIKLGADDSELAGARKAMDDAISRLQSATEFAIVGNTEKLQSTNIDLKLNEELPTKIMQSQSGMLENVLEMTQEVQNDLHKLLLLYDEKRRDETKQRPKPLSQKN